MSGKRRWIIVAIVLGLCLAGAIYHQLSAGGVVVDSGRRQIMGTFARVVAVCVDSKKAEESIEAAFEQLEVVDDLMSNYKETSEISRVNREAFKWPVKVGRPVFEVLRRSVEYSRKTGGAFDVTIGPVADLWQRAGERGAVPSEQGLAEARAKTGFEKLLLDESERTVRFAVDGMRIDLGGIAKGYGIDLAVEAMQKAGAIGGMVDVGGDIRCFGDPPRGRSKWVIGLQDPRTTDEEIVLVLELADEAVATSGHYRRFVLIGEKSYSHIINPATSTSAAGPSSVTVIAKNATDADAMATAVTVMGQEKGLALIEGMADTEAILILPGPAFEYVQTAGAGGKISRKKR